MSSVSSGITSPTSQYVNSISEFFPNPNRVYKIEGSFIGKNNYDQLPSNANLSDMSISDSYVEFLLPASQEEFIDTASMVIEMELKVTMEDGSDIDGADHISTVDNIGERILSSASIFLNGVQIENNSNFGLYNSIQTYLSMGKEDMETFGRNMFCKHYNDKNFRIFDADSMKSPSATESAIISACRDVIHLMIPLKLDIATANFYLLNAVDMRMRFQLAAPSVVLNSASGKLFTYGIRFAKLFCKKALPNPPALLSLNRSLTNDRMKSVQYITERPIIKEYIFPQNHSSLNIDDVFHGIRPHKVFLFMINQNALNGAFTRNAAYLENLDVGNLSLEVNSMVHSAIKLSFPNKITNAFYHTLSNLRSEKNLLTYANFKHGRTLFCWDLTTSDTTDTINVEKTGNIRITIQTEKAVAENTSVYIVGITNGVIHIDGNRRVKCNYLM